MSTFEIDLQVLSDKIVATFRSTRLSAERKLTIFLSLFVNKELLRITLSNINPDKTVTLSGRVFHLRDDFESKNKDYLGSENLARIHLDIPLRVRISTKNITWFEAFVICLARGYLPNNLDMSIYKSFSKDELKKAISGRIPNLLATKDDINYIKRKNSIAIPNLIAYYNLLHPNNRWRKTFSGTTSREIQLALNISTPLDTTDQSICRKIYEKTRSKLGIITPRLIQPPKNIEELLEMDRRKDIGRYNNQQIEIKRWLTENCMDIVETNFITGERHPQYISKKIKYMYKYKGLENQIPRKISHTAPFNLLEKELEYIKSV